MKFRTYVRINGRWYRTYRMHGWWDWLCYGCAFAAACALLALAVWRSCPC